MLSFWGLPFFALFGGYGGSVKRDILLMKLYASIFVFLTFLKVFFDDFGMFCELFCYSFSLLIVSKIRFPNTTGAKMNWGGALGPWASTI